MWRKMYPLHRLNVYDSFSMLFESPMFKFHPKKFPTLSSTTNVLNYLITVIRVTIGIVDVFELWPWSRE